MTRVRFDLRLVGAAVLALIAGLGVLALTRPPQRVAVLVAAEDLPAGAIVGEAALGEADVEPLDGLLLVDDVGDIAEWTLSLSIPAGAPITHAMISPPTGSTPDLVGLTLDRAHAVQGRIVPGDLVDIYITDDEGAHLLATGIQVVLAEVGSGGLGGNAVSLLLAVRDRSLVAELVTAIHSSAIDLVLVSP